MYLGESIFKLEGSAEKNKHFTSPESAVVQKGGGGEFKMTVLNQFERPFSSRGI